MLHSGKWNARAEGTWEKIWTHSRGKVPLLGRVRGGEADFHRKLPVPEHVHVPVGSQRAGLLWHRLWAVRSLFLSLQETGFLWHRLQEARSLLLV